MKKLIILGLLSLFWLIPNPGKAVVMLEHDLVSVKSIEPLQTVNLIHLDKKGIEGKVVRIPIIKETVASKLVIWKQIGYANKTKNKPKNNLMAIIGLALGLTSILLIFLTPVLLSFYLLLLGFTLGVLGLIISAIALKRNKRDPVNGQGVRIARLGLYIGLVITLDLIIG